MLVYKYVTLIFLFFFLLFEKAYIALSNMKRWGSSDGLFYLDEFYDSVVSIFEDNAGSSWAEETLEWWNQ
jgi:hypothetical protein